MQYRICLWTVLVLTLSGCGVLTTTAVVAGAVVVTAADLAVDGAVLVGKGVVKTGEVIVDAVKSENPDKAAQP
jgi:hypothetical protein